MALYQSEPKGIYIWNNGTPRLPSAYQEVEYIRNTGWQYIDTGYICSNNTEVEFKMWWWTQSWSHQMFWARDYWWAWWRWYAIVTDAYQFDGNAWATHWMTDGNIHTGSFWQDWLYVDWDLKAQIPTATFTCSRNLYLFCLNAGWQSEQASMRYYYFKMYESWVLVRDFVPCYRKSDNEPWMYDMVNNVFYTNQWSWTFTVWSDTVPIDRKIKHVYKGSVQVRPSVSI